MRWLIVEDALRDRKGHWFEYVGTFVRGLRELGDDVAVLVDHHAEPFILETLDGKPVLPDSIWHRLSDGAGSLLRYLRVPLHAVQTWWAMRQFLGRKMAWDLIFVPTVSIHHLLGWYLIARSTLRKSPARLVLFFPFLPIRLDSSGTPRWQVSPTTRLMQFLLRALRKDILAGRIVLGVETREMQAALQQLSRLPALYLPHPVTPLAESSGTASGEEIVMACYGPGRKEKGSDILQAAIQDYLQHVPQTKLRFVFQWLGGFRDERGNLVELLPSVQEHPRVQVIQNYFGEGEYKNHLLMTHLMLLPYRRSSYGLRVSRVVIEAMVNGIPVVVTRQTTLATQAAEFGAAVECDDGSSESLAAAMAAAGQTYPELRARALERMPLARKHFSVQTFRELLMTFPSISQPAGE